MIKNTEGLRWQDKRFKADPWTALIGEYFVSGKLALKPVQLVMMPLEIIEENWSIWGGWYKNIYKTFQWLNLLMFHIKEIPLMHAAQRDVFHMTDSSDGRAGVQ